MIKFARILHSSKAAIDLASIMVGVIIVSIIGGVIAATVFAVIPWAQDSAAKHQLVNIQTAQSAQRGLSVEAAGLSSEPQPAFISAPLAFINTFGASSVKPAASGSASFANLQQLQEAGLFTTSSGIDTASGGMWDKEGRICVVASDTETGSYDSAVVSDSGRTFVASFAEPKPMLAEVGDPTCLGSIEANGQPSVTNNISATGSAVPAKNNGSYTVTGLDGTGFNWFDDPKYDESGNYNYTKGTFNFVTTIKVSANGTSVVDVKWDENYQVEPLDNPTNYVASASDKALLAGQVKAYYQSILSKEDLTAQWQGADYLTVDVLGHSEPTTLNVKLSDGTVAHLYLGYHNQSQYVMTQNGTW